MSEPTKRRIQSLQSLRFLFILMIFFSHFSWKGIGAFDFGGDCGVSFFFILSGFVLSISNSDLEGIKFFKKRVSKIYPVHLLCLLVAFICMPWAFDNPKTALASISLTQSWIPSRDIYFGANGVAWFLSDITVFYLAYPWLKRAIFSLAPWKLAVTAFTVAIVYCLLIAPAVPDHKVNWLLYVFPPMRIIDFCFGIILARIYLAISTKDIRFTPTTSTVIEFSSMLLLAGSLYMYMRLSERYTAASLFWLPCGAAVIAFAITDSSPGLIGLTLKNKVLLWLGAISFEFYLLHVSMISINNRIAGHYGLDIPYAAALAITLGLTVAASIAVHWSVSRLHKAIKTESPK